MTARQFGEKLRQTRVARNVSQSYVATLAKVSVPTYRKLESGESTVEWGLVIRVLQILDLDITKLLSAFPSEEPTLRLKDLLAPTRKNSYRRKFHG